MREAEPGPLHPTDPALAAADPFWHPVRRRHPDVDLVLLDPGGPPDPPGSATDGDGAVAAQVTAVRAAWAALRSLVETALGGLEPPAPIVRWSGHGTAHRLSVELALRAVGRDAGTRLLTAMLVELGRQGWRLAPETRRGASVLRAVAPADGVELRAEAGAGATVLRLRGRALRLSAAALERAESEAASWE